MGFSTYIGLGTCGKCGAASTPCYGDHDAEGRYIERCRACTFPPSVSIKCAGCSAGFSEEEAMNCPDYPDTTHGLFCSSVCLDAHNLTAHDLRRLA